jgi:hypothetical protein
MIEQLFSTLLTLAAAYLLAGMVVAVLFFTRWLETFDPAAVAGSRGFRVLVTPGIIALWPLILIKVLGKKSAADAGGAEALRRNHRIAFILIAILGTLLFAAALAWRAPGFADLPKTEIPQP